MLGKIIGYNSASVEGNFFGRGNELALTPMEHMHELPCFQKRGVGAGDAINAILAAVGYIFRFLLNYAVALHSINSSQFLGWVNFILACEQ
jgi:hypothetical protein